MVMVSLVAVSEGVLSLQCVGASFLVVGGRSLLYLPQSDSSLGVISEGILSHHVWCLLSSKGGVLLLSCGSGLRVPLELQRSLLLGCDEGPLQGCLLFFWQGRYSSQILAWIILSTCEVLLRSHFRGLFSICGRVVPLCFSCLGGLLSTGGGEDFSSFVGVSSVMWSVAPLVLQERTRWLLSSCIGQWCSSIIALCGGLFSTCSVQSHLTVAHGQHTT